MKTPTELYAIGIAERLKTDDSEAIKRVLGTGKSFWQRLRVLGDAAARGEEDAIALLGEADAGTRTVSNAYDAYRVRHPSQRPGGRKDGAVPTVRAVERAIRLLIDAGVELRRLDLSPIPPADGRRLADLLRPFRQDLNRTLKTLEERGLSHDE